MDKFKPGDKVMIINAYKYKSLTGTECIIVRKLLSHEVKNNLGVCYAVDIKNVKNPIGLHVFEQFHLKKINDGDEKSSWSECAWKPKELAKT